MPRPGRAPTLVGARITSMGGIRAEDVETLVRPLVPGDNVWSRLDNLPYGVSASGVHENASCRATGHLL